MTDKIVTVKQYFWKCGINLTDEQAQHIIELGNAVASISGHTTREDCGLPYEEFGLDTTLP